MPTARGKLFVIAAPSGAGKTSLVRALMQRRPALRFSISYTTRQQRAERARRATTISSSTRTKFERMIDGRRIPRARARLRQLLRHVARAGRAAARRRRERAAGNRLAGRAADPPRDARVPLDLHPAAVARSARAAPARPQARTATRSSRAGCAIRSPTCRTGTSSTMSSSTTTSTAPPAELEAIVDRPGRAPAARPMRELRELLARLLVLACSSGYGPTASAD